MSLKVSCQQNGDLLIKSDTDYSMEDLTDFLHLSKEKKKSTSITINGIPADGNTHFTAKDKVIVSPNSKFRFNDDTPIYVKGVPVVYEDDYVLVANKKPFLLVHGDGNQEDSLTARVNWHLAQNGAPFPAQPVNRIDYEASGLVLFAKHPLVKSYLDQQMEDGTARKEYLAVIDGRVQNREIDINNPIGRNRHEAEKMMVYTKGKPAHTHISRLKLYNDKTLVKAAITTGRKHQIRVHLANLGYPIMNDPLYGMVSNKKGLMLQAYHLQFLEPFTSEPVDVQLEMDSRFKWFDPSLAEQAGK